MTIMEKVAALPLTSGVYIMKDKDGVILYIGKAKKLRNRVRSYFNDSVKTEKVMALMSKVVDFDYILTTSEVEALVLENTLIKENMPHYNILLKDDKLYPFIKISVKEPFPRVTITRKLKNDKSKYFGPYMLGLNISELLKLIDYSFPLRKCNLDLAKTPKNHRPCLNYHIGLCKAPCTGNITSEEYNEYIADLISFLNGNDKKIKDILTEKMLKASLREDYAAALNYKNMLKLLEKLVRKQVVALANDFNMDVFGIAQNGDITVVAVLFVRGGKLVGGDKFPIIDDASFDQSSSLTTFIYQYYQLHPPVVSEVVTAIQLENDKELEHLLCDLKNSKINLLHPIQGTRRQLADIAYNNAREYLEKAGDLLAKKQKRTIGAVVQLKQLLGLPKLPNRMECYDIAHIQGTNTVGSMVVFEGGEKKVKDYRAFKIKRVVGVDDFHCMQEVLDRRLEHYLLKDDKSFGATPDLLVIDGGFGQVAKVVEAVAAKGLDIPIIGLAKREEIVCMPDGREVILPRDSYALYLLENIRDEAHRFANTYHNRLRRKQQTEMALYDIEGVGKKRAAAIMARFKNIENLKKATIEQICEVEGISKAVATKIFEYINSKEN